MKNRIIVRSFSPRGGARIAAALAGIVAATSMPIGDATGQPEAANPSLLVFLPHPSDWTPDYTVFPYNLWQVRVTPDQITAQRESCQWFNAQYDILMGQTAGFQTLLGDRHDNWEAAGIPSVADTVTANIDQSAAFLDGRAHALYIINYPDQSEYSPLYNGDSIYHLWYQLTQISDKLKRRLPSGQIHANVATAMTYGDVIRRSAVCIGA